MYMYVFNNALKMAIWTFKVFPSTLIDKCFIPIWIAMCCVQNINTVASDKPCPIRLINGPTPYEGRVEVFYDAQWGSVCDDIWGHDEAEVVCRQLGFNGSIRAVKQAFYGEGDGPIMLDNVQCIGNETALSDCAHNDWYYHNCFHFEDAGVVCEWAENTVRVHHDTGKREVAGRVEIFHNGTWGTICNSQWDLNDTEVVCRQVGFAAAAQLISTTNFNSHPGPIVLSDVQCTGYENELMECTHSRWDGHSCSDDHDRDVGIICFDEIDNYDLRLVDENIYDNDYDSGRVQIFINGTWGSICSEGWNSNNAKVVCRQLGYEAADHVTLPYEMESMRPFYMTNVNCTGNEAKLINCPHRQYGSPVCAGAKDTFVRCKGPRVRLNGGPRPYEGRVEVLHHGTWGTICGSTVDSLLADLICNQLGFDGADNIIIGGEYGSATGPIMLQNVICDEMDDYLSDCTHKGWFVHDCDHSLDIGLLCDQGPEYRVRLLDSRGFGSRASTNFEGRVEMYVDGAWGTVCDTNWDMADANVVCKELGYSKALQAKGGAYFGEGTGNILMDNVTCNDYEEYLSHCWHSGWYQHDGCTHANDAGVVCDPGEDTPIRLVGSTNEGIVETFHDGSWQTVCSHSWDLEDVQVVCRQLFHEVDIFRAIAQHRASDQENHLLGISCEGWEFALADCDHDGWGRCMVDIVPGAACYLPIPTYSEGDLRLMDGTRSGEGRVEIYHDHTWGTICDTNWDMSEAEVVCRQLDYPHALQATSGSVFGFGSGNIFLDYVTCSGIEDRLDNCLNGGWKVHSCDITREAGVVCGVADGTLRLVDGKNQYEGRIEIHYQGVWGTICDALWGLNDAQVACGQLGYGDAQAAFTGAHFGEGSGPVLLDYISCYGYEDRIDECLRGDWHDTDCDHSRDAGIRCTNPTGSNGNDVGFTNIPLILGVLLSFLCILLWCYKPCCKLIKKHQDNNNVNDHFLNEIPHPNDFSDFEIVPDDDLPTYQDATLDVPPSYECLYGEAGLDRGEENENNGLDNVAQSIDEVNHNSNGGNEDTHVPGVNADRDQVRVFNCDNERNGNSEVNEENILIPVIGMTETQTESQRNIVSENARDQTRNDEENLENVHNEILPDGRREHYSPRKDNSESPSPNNPSPPLAGEDISDTNVDLSRTQEPNGPEMGDNNHSTPCLHINLPGACDNDECSV